MKRRIIHVLAVAVLVAGAGCGERGGHDRVALASRPLPPERFRPLIGDLERTLFARPPLGPEDRVQLSRAFLALAEPLAVDTASALSHAYSLELRVLSQRALSARPLERAELEGLRDAWKAIRGGAFDDAPWFAWHEGETTLADGDSPADTRDAAARSLDLTLYHLEALLRRGIGEVDSLGEPVPNPTTLRDRNPAHGASWRLWRGGWLAELDEIERGIVSPLPAGASPELRYADHFVRGALSALREVPDGGGGWDWPTRAESAARFRKAAAMLEEAGIWLSRTPRRPGIS